MWVQPRKWLSHSYFHGLQIFRSLLANTHIPTAPPCNYCSLKQLSRKCEYCENRWQTLYTVVNELPPILPHFLTNLDKILYGMTSNTVMLLLLLLTWVMVPSQAVMLLLLTWQGVIEVLFAADILFWDHPQTTAQTAQVNNKANRKPCTVYFWRFQTKSIVFMFYSILFYM
jgi:hypothetical protein